MADRIEGVQMRGFDVFNIRRRMSSGRAESEMIDFEAEIDRTLNYHENLQNIERRYGLHVGSDTRRALEQGPARINRLRDREGEFYQTGRTHREIDEILPALPPGFRRTSWGTSYTERRRNRSDRPGGRV